MKKGIILIAFTVVLFGVGFYLTGNYSENKNNMESNTQNSSTQQLADSVPTTSPEEAGSTATSSTQKPTTKSDDNRVKAIDFTLKDLQGNTVSLSDLKGKKVLLNFWATWCPPCKAEMPDIEKVYQEYKDDGLVVLAVDIGEKQDKVKEFVENNGYTYTVLLDTDQAVASKYNISAIPASYFIDPEGNVVKRHVGSMTERQIKDYLKMIE